MSLRDEIQAAGLDLQALSNEQIAQAISAGRVKAVSAPIGIGTVLAVMAPQGGQFLNALETLGATAPDVKWALRMIEQGTFDVGHPVTRGQLQQFAADNPGLAGGIAQLLKVAEVADPVTEYDVRCALYNPLTGERLI